MLQQAVKNPRRLSARKFSAWAGACLGAVVLAAAALIFLRGGAILDGYGKRKAERAFAQAHPGLALRIGQLEYSVGANRLTAQSLTLSATNSTLKIGRISVTGVGWASLFWGKAALADVLAKASLDATNLDLEFPKARYGVRCARLRASAPDSELIAEGAELRTLVGDDEFFAADKFRLSRFHVVVPECRVSGLEWGPALEGTACRARSVQFARPIFDALVDSDKPVGPFVKSPLMVSEALAAIRQPLEIASLSITNGSLRYCVRMAAGADPGVLTISAVNLSVEGIGNRGPASAAIRLQGQGRLMDAGLLKVAMSIPIRPPEFSLHYSGSLGAMDLTRLNPFLEVDTHARIKSGSAQEASFEIEVTAGQARGRVRGTYRDLEIAFLDKRSGAATGLDDRFASFLAKELKIRKSNPPSPSGAMKEGLVNYAKRPPEQFQQFAWFALRSGVLDIISH